MQRAALALALSLVAQLLIAQPARAIPEYDSQWVGQSDFLYVFGTEPQMFQVFFMNTGTATWIRHTSTEVVLAACLDDKVTCNVESPLKAWNAGYWASPRVYASQTPQEVPPGKVASFIWFIVAPKDVVSGQYVFHGDLMRLATGRMIHPQGYYQAATCACP